MKTIITTVFSFGLIKPLRVVHSILGESVWPPLEKVAAGLGWVSGMISGPYLNRRYSKKHPLLPAIKFVDFVEGSLGIQGTHEFMNSNTVRRLVNHCPFAGELESITPFCTRLGCVAGKYALVRILPECRFEILGTLSQGDKYCEYRYRLDSRDESA